jgi:hypothetical protein
MSNNPLKGRFRAPKSYTRIPSDGKFYSDEIITQTETGEYPVFAMTSKDEIMMRNPDALLNGESVAQVINSCVPAVKKPRELLGADVDALMVAINGATYGDTISLEATCPECSNTTTSVASVSNILSTMTSVPENVDVVTDDNLTITIKPVSYETSIAAGVQNFQSTRSLQSIANIDDDMERLKAFNDSYMKLAQINFLVLVDSVYSISGTDEEGEDFVVTDRANIQEYLENCETGIGNRITESVTQLNQAGIQKEVDVQCDNEECGHVFKSALEFDPVNFSTAS